MIYRDGVGDDIINTWYVAVVLISSLVVFFQIGM